MKTIIEAAIIIVIVTFERPSLVVSSDSASFSDTICVLVVLTVPELASEAPSFSLCCVC